MIAGEERFAAVEDAGRLRDALGVALAAGLPQGVPGAGRGTRCASWSPATRARHGPFLTADVARRFGTGDSPVAAALVELRSEGRVLEGRVPARRLGARVVRERGARDPAPALARPPAQGGRAGRSLGARPPPPRLARDHRGDGARAGPTRCSTSSSRSRARSVPASALERDVLPARLPRYRPGDLDTLCAAGEVVWAGMGPLGERDGRVAPLPGRRPAAALPPAGREAEGRSARAPARAPGPPRRVLLRRAPRGVGRRPPADGARRAVGPRVGGRGHERHAGRAARVPRDARGAGRSAVAASVPSARAATRRRRERAAGASFPLPRQAAHRHGPRARPRRAAPRAPRRADPRRGDGGGACRAASGRSIPS